MTKGKVGRGLQLHALVKKGNTSYACVSERSAHNTPANIAVSFDRFVVVVGRMIGRVSNDLSAGEMLLEMWLQTS